jgi:hypothetical protein
MEMGLLAALPVLQELVTPMSILLEELVVPEAPVMVMAVVAVGVSPQLPVEEIHPQTTSKMAEAAAEAAEVVRAEVMVLLPQMGVQGWLVEILGAVKVQQSLVVQQGVLVQQVPSMAALTLLMQPVVFS